MPGIILAALALCLCPGGCRCDGIMTPSADGPFAADADASDGVQSDEQPGEEPRHLPPSRFLVSAHVQTNIRTGVSHFVPPSRLPEDSHAHLPYLECGAVGSSTERLPLVSGVFRHVPRGVDTKRDAIVVDGMDLDEALRGDAGGAAEEEAAVAEGGGIGPPAEDEEDSGSGTEAGAEDEPAYPRRPSPPKYVVALTPLEIVVGGSSAGGSNETRRFDAGDVIFVEDTWWGVWDHEDGGGEEPEDGGTRMRGYEIRPSGPGSDVMTLMLTVPDAVHRRWKAAMFAAAEEDRRKRRRRKGVPPATGRGRAGHTRPWWRVTSRMLLNTPSSGGPPPSTSSGPGDLPEPCSLESDPTFTSSRASPSSLSEHLSRHFAGLLREAFRPSSQPRHAHRDLVLPLLVQSVSGLVGGLGALLALTRVWKSVPPEAGVRFGSACVMAGATLGAVRLGERVWDQVGDWRERRRMARLVDGGWGRVRE